MLLFKDRKNNLTILLNKPMIQNVYLGAQNNEKYPYMFIKIAPIPMILYETKISFGKYT